MKFANVSKGLLLGLTLLLATSMFAANIHSYKESLQLQNSVIVSGKTVPAGEYSVKWEGTGSNVQVNILQGRKVVASTSARVVDLDQSSGSNSAVLKNNGDGSKSLSEIRFNGKKYALAIDEGSPSAEMSGSSK
ncbi:MAG TPA: hypothetical protein VKR57_07050 [Terriglobales bacterium]|jgi:hypothetical protein|nr:hypothetical protein [Terriglobales bacterium]